MKTTQEEADTMIAQQVAEVNAKKLLVVADDTDICSSASLRLPR